MKAEYFQAVEQTFLQCTGRGLVISESDRTQIEQWFETGIPLQVVQQAVILSCADQEQKVRTIGIARNAVEKEFSVWQQRRLGKASEETLIPELSRNKLVQHLESNRAASENPDISKLLSSALDQLHQLEKSTCQNETWREGISRVEAELHESLWAILDVALQNDLDRSLDEMVDRERFFDTALADTFRHTHRRKQLREHFGLIAFDRFL